MSPQDLKKLSSALDSLKTALELVSLYKLENAKLVAALIMVAKMSRTGSSLADVAKFAEQALMLLGKNKA